MIGIRVDANDKIAMGHLMRCLSIAKSLRKKGEEVVFISSESNIKDVVCKENFNFIALNNRYDDKESEIEQLLEIIRLSKIEIILLDSYEVTELYMQKLYTSVKIVYIDDLNLFKYSADVIVNYTYNANSSIYEKWKYSNETQFYFGIKYIPLRSEFGFECIDFNDEVSNIFLTTGGTDNYDMIISILKQLRKKELHNININVVVGKFYNKIDELRKMESDSIRIYQNISNMYEIMKQNDIAISAGGTTVAELCSIGIPTIAFSIADNQMEGVKAYSEDGIIIYAGDVRENKGEVISNIVHNVEKLITNDSYRSELSLKSMTKIDGKGAVRIAELIIKLKYNQKSL
ncbi:MAG: UDP-2,4-diacetamido-2,4,6-trideoxy-beta-L-altropyranose hydrolase [Lachnospiraceae bacterium]|nr:UDP-2,4-diacetamido-2,4,6-trideoxy-beta-L-altropyranose hydrolase [Lachnospiraceae bacterium]